jgi:hypothetical protein
MQKILHSAFCILHSAFCILHQGVTLPAASTPKANPGSGPDPGVVTISVSNTSLAKMFLVAAPVGFSSQTFPSLTRIDWRTVVGTSLNVISHRSAAGWNGMAVNDRQLG